MVVADVTADDEAQTDAGDATNDAGISSNEYLTQQNHRSEYLSAIDCHRWNNSGEYVTCIDDRLSGSAKQQSGLAAIEQVRSADSSPLHRLNDTAAGVNKDSIRSGGSRLTSAMKLKCSVEPQQPSSQSSEHTDRISPLSELQSPVIRSPGVSAANDHKSPGSTNKPSSQTSHTVRSGRTLSAELPLGAEYDVKQIKVRRAPTNASLSPGDGDFDFFADMTPVIEPASSTQSLLGILSSTTTTADVASSLLLASTQPSARLSISTANHLHSTVSYYYKFCCYVHVQGAAKKFPPKDFWHFLSNGLFNYEILH